MKEPSPRASRLALTAGIVAVAIVGGGGFLLGQRSTPGLPTPVPTVAAPSAPAPAKTDSTTRILARADLLTLAAEAADATARNDPMPNGVRNALGKPFAISIPFGCQGPADAASEAGMWWRYDEQAGALRLSVTPVTWTPGDWWPADGSSRIDTIEGFWIPRPWTRSETCPASATSAAPVDAEPVTLAGQTLAIGQAFGTEGARQGQRDGKAYSSVLRMALDGVDTSRGLSLRLTGRISASPSGSPVVCRQPGGADQRPVCLVLVSLDELAIADPVADKVLVSWPTGSLRESANGR